MYKNKNNLISVLIPSYNHENYVQGTIKSIINQTYENIELIVIDDGSKDDTYKKILELKEECEKRFKRVHFETKENEGTVATFNKLASLAKGEYIYFIASDDMIADVNALKMQAEFLDKNKKYCLVVGDNQFIDSNGQICYWDEKQNVVYSKNKAGYLTFGDSLKAGRSDIDFNSSEFGKYYTFLKANYIPNGYLIRKSIFDLIPKFTNEAPLEDYFLHLQLSKYGKYKYIDKVLFSYRWHSANTIKNIEKMQSFTQKTLDYEYDVVQKNICASNVCKAVFETIKYGTLYKKLGVPFLFQIKKYKDGQDNKQKYLIIFGFKIKLNS